VPSSSTSTIVGWTLSFVIYIVIVVIGAYMLQSHNTKTIKYTANKKNLLNVTLVERKEKKVVKTKKKKKIVKKKTTVNRPKPVEKKKTVRAKERQKKQVKPNFKKLFENIKVDDLPKESPKREKKIRKKVVQKKVEEVVKDEKAKKITKALEFEQQESLIIAQNDGLQKLL